MFNQIGLALAGSKFLPIHYYYIKKILAYDRIHNLQMDSNIGEKKSNDYFPFFKIADDGTIERYLPTEKIPPFDDPHTGVKSKDVLISSQPTLFARIFIPEIHALIAKLPILLYFHGGGFSTKSACDALYHNYIASLVKAAHVIAVSVDYRLAPEDPIPACYDDSWTAFQWLASHANGSGQETWLNTHGDFGQVFIGGDSAGANISYNLAVRVGSSSSLSTLEIQGMIMVHPYLMGTIYDRVWLYLCPKNEGVKDARMEPRMEDMRSIACKRVIVSVAGKDPLRDTGLSFYNKLKNSGWKGNVRLVMTEGLGHVFHLFKPKSDQSLLLMKHLVSFIHNQQQHDQLFRCRL
ncbi:probable carboxylesterase 5 [Mercurialis annua]|uniref:probable carboxylesterase 5 n=1 Tax=Mercurialis annua TaxID=3986 RepID=UPI00215E5C6F|nr:probable carboxylesterase 5 [Mercurialis annua]